MMVINKIKSYFRELKWFIQRGKKGWADCDIWNLDFYIAKIISEGLKRLEKIKTAYPSHLTNKKWNKILNNIIWTFELAQKISSGDIYYIPKDAEDWDRTRKNLIKTNKMIAKQYNRKPNKVITKRELNKLEKGFQLFIKYFYQLWD